MKITKNILVSLFCLAVPVAGFAQSLSVTSTGVEITGNSKTTGSATVGSLVVGTSTILTTGTFESAEQALPGNGFSLTIPHGLGGMPKFVTVSMRCKVADLGWEVGDEIMLNSINIISNNNGTTVAVNPVNIKLTQYGSIHLLRFMQAGNNVLAVTPASWRLVFRAWR